VSGADVRAYEPKVFAAFEQECQQIAELKNYIAFQGGHEKGDR
jgi:hypothetical protein